MYYFDDVVYQEQCDRTFVACMLFVLSGIFTNLTIIKYMTCYHHKEIFISWVQVNVNFDHTLQFQQLAYLLMSAPEDSIPQDSFTYFTWKLGNSMSFLHATLGEVRKSIWRYLLISRSMVKNGKYKALCLKNSLLSHLFKTSHWEALKLCPYQVPFDRSLLNDDFFMMWWWFDLLDKDS